MNINVAETSFSISRVIASNLRVNQQIAPSPASPAQAGGGVTLTLSQKKLASVIMSWRPGALLRYGSNLLQIWAINAQKLMKMDSSTQHIIL